MNARAEGGRNNDLIRPSFERVDERGTLLEVLNAGRWESVLWGQMKAQAVMGNHYHKRTDVFLFLISGHAEVTSLQLGTGARKAMVLEASEGIMLKANVAHAIHFKADSSFIMLKSVRYDNADPDTFPCRVLGMA